MARRGPSIPEAWGKVSRNTGEGQKQVTVPGFSLGKEETPRIWKPSKTHRELRWEWLFVIPDGWPTQGHWVKSPGIRCQRDISPFLDLPKMDVCAPEGNVSSCRGWTRKGKPRGPELPGGLRYQKPASGEVPSEIPSRPSSLQPRGKTSSNYLFNAAGYKTSW